MTQYILMLRLITGEVGPVETYNPIMCRMVELRVLMGKDVSTDRVNPDTQMLELQVPVTGAKCVKVGPFELALAP